MTRDPTQLRTPADVIDIASREHWDATYTRVPGIPDYAGVRPERVLRAFMAEHLLPHPNQRLLELGAGNTAYLPIFRQEFGYRVAGLDYSALGCELARRNLAAAGVEGEIVEADLFEPPEGWRGAFDVVFTMGVAEHFDDTTAVIGAFAQYMAPSGRMLTVIPNMHGLNGVATRRLSRELFDRHVALTPEELAYAHERAGLTVLSATYLAGVNAWVANPGASTAIRRALYAPFLALTRALWAIEDRGLVIRPNRLTSPMVVVVARA